MEEKNRVISRIEEKMETLPDDPLRRQALQCVKEFKTSWIELGRSLYQVWQSKQYKKWGFNKFDIYVQKELGIKPATGVKLLRSYYFLEKEEPAFLKKEMVESARPAEVPSYESVNQLRLAKSNKSLDESDYDKLKKKVLEKGSDVSDIKKEVTSLIRQREEISPAQARHRRKEQLISRFISTLKSIRQDIELSKLLEADYIPQIDKLMQRLESALDEEE